jgi:hypothetical protein
LGRESEDSKGAYYTEGTEGAVNTENAGRRERKRERKRGELWRLIHTEC